MKAKLKSLLEKLLNNYWFLPATMAVGAIVLSQVLLYIDQTMGQPLLWSGKAFLTTGIEGARSTLATIASSMITVTGVVFSITIVSLSLASQQFGPRLLQHFMRDRGNQFVLGTVTSTFLYCLLVLRTIGSPAETAFVPHGCVFVAVVMAVLNVGVLIYFINHTAEAIQVGNVIHRISSDLSRVVRRLYPEEHSTDDGESTGSSPEFDLPGDFDDRAAVICSDADGYIQTFDPDSLVELATRKDLIIRLLRRPGHYLVEGSPLAKVYPGDELDADISASINDRFVCGSKRSQEYDLEFLVNELVEIASRALSPGVNDPFTAITCIDHLSSSLCDLAKRSAPAPERFDSDGNLRVIVYPTGFSKILDGAFNQIRQYARSHASVTIRLLESLHTITGFIWNADQREAVIRQAIMIERGSREGLPEAMDANDVSDRYGRIFKRMRERSIPASSGREKSSWN
jgi:uncharacterized membrane protein